MVDYWLPSSDGVFAVIGAMQLDLVCECGFDPEPTIELGHTISFMVGAHGSQRTMGGDPYWMHPVEVARIVRRYHREHKNLGGCNFLREVQIALLHDVIEDTSHTVESLLVAGVDRHVVAGVDSVSHPLGWSYDEYISRVIESGPQAMRVKLADNEHKMQPDRLAKLRPETAVRLRDKYTGSAARLRAALGV